MALYLGLLSCMQKNKDENVYPTELILLILARVITRIKTLLCTIFRAKNDAFNQPKRTHLGIVNKKCSLGREEGVRKEET